MKLFKNKKGSARDVVLLVAVLFMFAVGFLLSSRITTSIVDGLQENDFVQSSPTANATLSVANDLTGHADWLMLVVYIGFLIGIILTAFMLDSHPVFFIIYLIILVIAIFLSAMFGYMWYETSSASAFTETISDFTITDFLMGKLPLFTAAAGFIGLIVMYAKSRYGAEQ